MTKLFEENHCQALVQESAVGLVLYEASMSAILKQRLALASITVIENIGGDEVRAVSDLLRVVPWHGVDSPVKVSY